MNLQLPKQSLVLPNLPQILESTSEESPLPFTKNKHKVRRPFELALASVEVKRGGLMLSPRSDCSLESLQT